jgi:ABC-type transport system involved in cytochrome bd biosynthesis fused ATPase/permease subunit
MGHDVRDVCVEHVWTTVCLLAALGSGWSVAVAVVRLVASGWLVAAAAIKYSIYYHTQPLLCDVFAYRHAYAYINIHYILYIY